MAVVVGLDVGGAHLKIAVTDNGNITAVQQIPCKLWLGLHELDSALQHAVSLLSKVNSIAVTMTGELSDVFPDRATGVETIVDRMHREFAERAQYWMGRHGFGTASEAKANHRDVGSTNFLATATLIARSHRDALLIDFGSTTADIIPILDANPVVTGMTDALRQTSGELVYTGFTRTAVMGVANRAPFQGQWVSFAREYLATMADVRRLLGFDLSEFDQHATADGKDKTLSSSIARFARMLGRDASEGTLADWQGAAAYVRHEQLRSIEDGVLQVLSRTALPSHAPIVAAGAGAMEVALIAERLGRPFVPFATLVNTPARLEAWTTACAPAVSVALLISKP